MSTRKVEELLVARATSDGDGVRLMRVLRHVRGPRANT